MAPSTAFRKATKSAFSPPRPGKSKTATKSTKEKKGATTKSAARHSSLGRVGNSKIHKQKQRKPRVGRQGPKPKRKGAAAGTMRAILGEASSEDDDEDEDQRGAGSEDNENMDTAVDEDDNLADEDEDEDDDDDDDNNNNAQESEDEVSNEEEPSLPPDRTLTLSSPEPDFILAEVTTTSTSSTSLNPPIPLPLIHRIMHAHFSSPDKTSISSDARHLMGKYTEIFVKEAIRRCVDDKRERATHKNGDGDGAAVVGDTGWLEVEDLERVGVQLCLDF